MNKVLQKNNVLFWVIQISVWTLFFIFNLRIIYIADLKLYADDPEAFYYGLVYLFVFSYTGLLLTLIVRYIYKKVENRVTNLISHLLIILLLSFILANFWFLEIIIFDRIISNFGYQVSSITFRYYAWEIVQGLMIIFSWSATYLFIKIWMKSIENKVKTEKAVLEAENAQLKFLQYQLNPHFLFNSLNNINSFAQRDPDKTSYAIIKLSEIMRYMLYETKGKKVLLEKEIKYIESFLDLQKLRFSNNNFIEFKVTGLSANVFVPPLLFISFIENAFKYSSKSDDKSIQIIIEITPDKLIFKCSNKIIQVHEPEFNQQGGIGIKNIKKRLELLYNDKYVLNIDKTENYYSVYLEIPYHEN